MTEKKDDWKFSIEEEKIEEIKEESKGEPALKRARNKQSKKLKLDKSDNVKFRQGRLNSANESEKNKAIKYKPSSVEDRFQALVFDLIMPSLGVYFIPEYLPEINSLVAPYLGVDSADPNYIYQQTNLFVRAGLFILIYLITTVPFLSKGATLGLKIKKLSLNHIDGGTLTFIQSLLRQTIGVVVNVISVIGLLMPLFHKQKRTLHDLMFKTICEKED